MRNPKITVPNPLYLSQGARTQKLLKSPNFLDFKGQNKRFLDCLIRLRLIESWRIRKLCIEALGSILRTRRP